MIDFLCAIPILSSLFTACQPAPPLAVGYVEGEYVLIAPVETAEIISVDVQRGDKVSARQVLVQLEQRDSEIAVAQAKAALAKADSELANLREGKRPEEIAVIEVALQSAKAQAAEANRVLRRQTSLLESGTTTRASFDEALTNAELARAKVAELEADLAVAKLPARNEQIKAAEAAVAQARASLENAEWRLQQRTLRSSKPATVFDIVRHPGEIAGPQAPVLSLLPDGATKLRLYLPEQSLSSVNVGTRLSVHCDGCDSVTTATVNYVAPDPEFTPPVIYSLENRQKLVYLVEALPDSESSALKPGQIVDVELSSAQQ